MKEEIEDNWWNNLSKDRRNALVGILYRRYARAKQVTTVCSQTKETIERSNHFIRDMSPMQRQRVEELINQNRNMIIEIENLLRELEDIPMVDIYDKENMHNRK